MLETLISQALYGVSYGLLLFMLAAGLTLIFSMMGVLNFAHASFYMLGAYFGYQFSAWMGFWPALLISPPRAAVIDLTSIREPSGRPTSVIVSAPSTGRSRAASPVAPCASPRQPPSCSPTWR